MNAEIREDKGGSEMVKIEENLSRLPPDLRKEGMDFLKWRRERSKKFRLWR